MNNRQVALSDLYAIIGGQTVEIELLKGQIQQLQLMIEGLQKATEEAKNGVPLDDLEKSGKLPT